jgi:hemoglobin-like flavoprotein
MADKSMQLVIGVDIKDVNAAINKTKALENQVKRIVDAHRSGKIDIDNYNRGLSETKKSYDSVSTSSRKSAAEIRK